MGMDKQGSRSGSGGFLQLFDWNRKSRKKLFSNNSDFLEGSKQGKRSSINLPVTRTHLIDEDEHGRSSVKGSSDYSCSSSVTDDDGNGVKAPGVVARLMGLDSLPTTSVSEPFSTPYFDSRSLRDSQYRRTTDFVYERQLMNSGKLSTRMDGFPHNPIDVRPQKLGNRPIERFQTEMLPPRSAKFISVTHNKLFSPIKSPGYIPTKNAAQIMEEAAKIIEPGPHASSKGKMPLVGTSSVPLKFRSLTEKMETVQRSSRQSEASQRPVESKSMKHLKGQALSKSWNGVEEEPQFKSFPPEESNFAGSKNKGKSISLAVQAKVNLQKRGGLSSSSNPSLQGKREHKELKSNQSFKNHPDSQKNMPKKPSTPSVSGVLRQNNQKQNCSTNKEKLKAVVPNQQGRKALSMDAPLGQKKASSKITNSKVGQRKSALDNNDAEKVVQVSRAKSLPRKKRAMEGYLYHERSGFADPILVNNAEKPFQPNVTIEGHSKWTDDNRRKGMDVVSFTFTSPMKKTVTGSKASSLELEKHTSFGVGSSYDKISSDKNITKLSSLGLNVIGGDALNVLLEQKLRELAYGIESSSCNKPMNIDTSASTQSDLISDLNSVEGISPESDRRSELGLHRDNNTYDLNCFSTESHLSQGVEDMGEQSVNSCKAREGFNCRHPSPVSILEPCFSNESCNSSDSADSQSMNESLQCSSTQSQVVATSSKRLQSMEADVELSDSASSTCSGNFGECETRFSTVDFRSTDKMELEYVREVISNTDSTFKDVVLCQANKILNPQLFDQLENHKTWSRSADENKESRLSRRVLFDCVGECLDLRCRPYVSGSWTKWSKGEAMLQEKEWLAEETHREISGLRSQGDWILDDLVDKDMSSRYGKWVDFEIEEFEVGEDIGKKILSSLLDDVVADILVL